MFAKHNSIELAITKPESPGKKHPVLPIGVFLPGFYPAVWLVDISLKTLSFRSTNLPLSDQHLSDRPNRNPRGIKLLRSS
jgi:hypothetical protein